MAKKPKIVYERVDFPISYIPLKDLIPKLQKAIDEYGEDACLEVKEEYDYYKVILEWSRPENEDEKAKRLREKAMDKERRKQAYDRLKKEFGDG